jgi:ribosomal protein S18 acetylase RimI-like enzyme
MDFIVRPGVATDAPALAELAAVTFPLACPPYHTPENIALHLAEVLSEDSFDEYATEVDDYALFVAQANGKLVGFSLLDCLACDDDVVEPMLKASLPSMELSKVYVHPDAHGSGVAQALFEACQAEARDREAASLWLTVWRENARALRFYEKNGFSPLGERLYPVGDLVDHDLVCLKVFSKGD